MNDAAALLARMRKRKGVSMSTLSAVAGIPVSTISRIEAGKVEPTWSTMRRLSAAAGYDITTELKESGGDEPLAGIIDCLEKAAPEKRASVVTRFPVVALLCPVAFRRGTRMVERLGSLGGLCRELEGAGQRPAISSFEAFVGETERFSSVFSVVYVDDPASVRGMVDCVGLVNSAVYLARRTDRLRALVKPGPGGPWRAPLSRYFSWELHQIIAQRLRADPGPVMARIAPSIAKTRPNATGGALAWFDEWDQARQDGPDAVIRLCELPGDHGDDLRKVGPFLGVLTPEDRALALARAQARRQQDSPGTGM